MAKTETPEARAERITAELRAATSEAAGALKDLTAAAKAARQQCEDYLHDEVVKALKQYTADIHEQTQCYVDEGLAEVQKVMQQGCKNAAEHITGDTMIIEIIKEITTQTIVELQRIGYDFGMSLPT